MRATAYCRAFLHLYYTHQPLICQAVFFKPVQFVLKKTQEKALAEKARVNRLPEKSGIFLVTKFAERFNKLFDKVFNLIYKFNKSLYKIVHEKDPSFI